MRRLNNELVQSGQLADHEMVERFMRLPEKAIQFGEGNFLRGFVDWMVHEMNRQGIFNGRIVAIQPTPYGKVVPKLNAQDGLYTFVQRGIEDNQIIDKRQIIASVSRGINPYTDWNQLLELAESPEIQMVFSNTTEAGIAYTEEPYNPAEAPLSFPGKLTACLYHRYKTFQASPEAAWSIIPCELIENNGPTLREMVLKVADHWELPGEFKNWVLQYNRFCTTLVDRIVTGYPKDNIQQFQEELGYEDELLTVGEPYHLFAIDADPYVEAQIPFKQAGLHVHWGDVTPFRELKVKILNGAHTMMCAAGYLSGKQTVLDVMEDSLLRTFVAKGIFEEILPFVNIEEETKRLFANSVLERFRNPFAKHYLLDISLNGISKFRTRLLPTLVSYVDTYGQLPAILVYSFTVLLVFYKSVRQEGAYSVGRWNNQEYMIRDHEQTLLFFQDVWSQSEDLEHITDQILANHDLWGGDLTEIAGLKERIVLYLSQILTDGINLNEVL